MPLTVAQKGCVKSKTVPNGQRKEPGYEVGHFTSCFGVLVTIVCYCGPVNCGAKSEAKSPWPLLKRSDNNIICKKTV